MKALILAGGKGTRFMEETDIKPKPMIEIDGKPLIIHIIDHYVKHGIKDFIILGGYKIDYFFKYFENQKLKDADEYFYIREDIKIKILDTGIETATGGRIKQAKKYLDEPFLMTYGDGLSNVNITELINYHESHNKLATVTAVRPPARFGSLTIENDIVIDFGEKIQSKEGWINGGYFVLDNKVLEYIENDSTAFEDSPLENLSQSHNLLAFKHKGFWYPVDTIREKQTLEKFIKDNHGKIPWAND